MTFRIPRKPAHIAVAVLLLLGNLLETLPLLHHHEEQHACIQTGDGYFFLETAAHHLESETGGSVPYLISFRVGDYHQHALCALCQLIPSFLESSPAIVVFSDPGRLGHHGGEPNARSSCRYAHLPRGPPSNA